MFIDKIKKLAEYPSRKRIRELEYKINSQQEFLDLLISDHDYYWLYKNRMERMDANSIIFDETRKEFHLQRYRFASKYIKGEKVADIACGTGYGTRILSQDGKAIAVKGIDIDNEAIEYAIRKYSNAGLTFKTASADNTGEDSESFDAIISFETIEHVPDDVTLVKEFSRILKPGGLLICSTPNNWPIDVSQHHLRTYDLNTISSLLKNKFNIEKTFNQNSGTDYFYNHNQPPGIVETDKDNFELAECYILVCRRK